MLNQTSQQSFLKRGGGNGGSPSQDGLAKTSRTSFHDKRHSSYIMNSRKRSIGGGYDYSQRSFMGKTSRNSLGKQSQTLEER
jgi:hypothetical protein